MNSLIYKIFNFFKLNIGHERSIRAKKNIFASFIIKGLNILIGLMLVPLTINYLNPTKYGIWITLSSVIGWFSFFDIGLGNGLRNKFSEAVAQGNHQLAKTYVSTTYAIMIFIVSIILIIFYLINPLINWLVILNTPDDLNLKNELDILAIIVFTFFCIRFVLHLISTVLTADQQPYKTSLLNLIANMLSLIFIFILTKTYSGSLLYLGTLLSSTPILVFFISSLWYYNRRYKPYKPSLKFVDLRKTKVLFSLGMKFFFIQISGILLYQTNNIIISQLFGPKEVTPYNIAFKYFNILMMIFAIIISPFWSAFTEAWVKNDLIWIKIIINRLRKICIYIVFIGVIMLFVSPVLYRLWIGRELHISFLLSGLVFLWVLLNIWNSIWGQFLNGVGKIKLQVILSTTVAILNVPFAVVLGKSLGINGILISNILLICVGAIIFPIQYKKLINKKAIGIWDK